MFTSLENMTNNEHFFFSFLYLWTSEVWMGLEIHGNFYEYHCLSNDLLVEIINKCALKTNEQFLFVSKCRQIYIWILSAAMKVNQWIMHMQTQLTNELNKRTIERRKWYVRHFNKSFFLAILLLFAIILPFAYTKELLVEQKFTIPNIKHYWMRYSCIFSSCTNISYKFFFHAVPFVLQLLVLRAPFVTNFFCRLHSKWKCKRCHFRMFKL